MSLANSRPQIRALCVSAAAAAVLLAACPSSRERSGTRIPQVAATSASTAVVGAVGASFSVGANGDAGYEVPIDAPPGINRVQPGLSLAYGSLSDNGLVGVGWSLKGLSAITRCKKIPEVDGERGTVTYTASDVYCLDGQRLINVSGAYGSGGSVYRTELETWRRVVASSDLCGSGPCSFTVTTKKGESWRYGGTADSRILAVGRSDVRVWAVDRVRDLNGNTIQIGYTQAPIAGSSAADGEFYPLRVDYTSNEGAKAAANRSLRFRWSSRSDLMSRYLGGSPILTRAILAGITTYLGETAVSDYRLTYTNGASTGRSRLASLQKCAGTDAGAACLSPTALTWQDAAKISYVGHDTTLRFPTTYDKIVPGDVNGDGRGDILFVSDDQPRIATAYVADGQDYSACGKTASIPKTGTAEDELLATDADGDGRTDLVFVWNDAGSLKITTYLATASGACGFSDGVTSATGQSGAYDVLYPMDVDGDGRTDVVTGQAAGNQLTVSTFLSAGTTYAYQGSTTIAVNGTAQDSPPFGVWATEVNGDGLLDLIASWSDGGALALTSYLSNGKTFGAGVDTTLGSGAGDLRVWPLDVNGDGLGDLVEAWKDGKGVLQLTSVLAAGDGTFVDGGTVDTGHSGTDFAAFWPMDVNGDGRTDVVQAWDDGGRLALLVYRNSGLGFDGGTATGTNLSSADVKTVFPLDFDGDAHMDLVQAWPDSQGLAVTNFIVQGAQPDLVATILDGWNGEIALTYAPLSDPKVYQDGVAIAPTSCAGAKGLRVAATSYPMSDAFSYAYVLAPAQAPFQVVGGGTMYVVDRSVQRNGAGAESLYTYADSYRYANGVIDRGGRGWLGFGRVSILDESRGLRTVNDYYQSFPLTGVVARTAYECDGRVSPDPSCPDSASDTLLRASTTCYDPVVTAGGATGPKPAVIDARKTRVQFDEYSYGTYQSSRALAYAYDAYGNTTLASDLGAVSRDGKNKSTADDVYTCSRFANDPTAWLLDYLDGMKVASTGACTDFERFDDKLDFSLTRVTYSSDGRMLPLARSNWDSGNKRFVQSTYTYDAFGNVTSETDPKGRLTSISFETAWNTYPESKTYPDTGSGRMSERLAFDPRFGSLAGRTDFNDVVAITCLDGFGRPLAMQGPPPDGASGDTNCASALLTGSAAPTIQAAKVASLQTNRWGADGAALYHEQSVLQRWTTGATPDRRWRRQYIDGVDRNYKEVLQGSDGNILTCRVYQSDDQVTHESVPAFTPKFGGACVPGGAGEPPLWTSTTYDVYGRLLEQVRPSGAEGKGESVTRYGYEGDDTTTVTYAATAPEAYSKVFQYAYFFSNRKTVAVTVPGDGNATTTFAYDRIGRLVSATDPATTSNPSGVTNRITYDSMDRQLTVDNPDQNTTAPGKTVAAAYTYDDDGLTTQVVDAKGQKTRFAYDGAGRPLTVTAADGAVITYSYDGTGSTFGLGRPTRITGKDAAGAVTFVTDLGYDAYGNTASSTMTIGDDPRAYTTRRTYDPVGRPATVTFPDGATQTLGYADGNLVSLAEGATAYASLSAYDALGNPGTITYGNGVAATLRYAPEGNLIGRTVTDKGGAKLADQTIGWDELLQVTGVEDLARRKGTDLSQAFTYASKRLTAARAAGTYGDKLFAYDAGGNLTTNDGVAYSYAAHRIVSGTRGGTTVFQAGYDADGNLNEKTVGGATWHYTYDARNHLVTISKDGQEVLFGAIYDQNGRRLRKREATGVETEYPDPSYSVTRLPGDVVLGTRTIAGESGTVATVTTVLSGTYSGPTGGGVPSPGTLYVHPDYLGSTSLTTDEQGGFATQVVYEPYGRVFSISGPDDFRPKFQGKEDDETAELFYFDARYYDPSIGRFLSPDDELGDQLYESDALNRFAFASNNPVTYTDPSGHNVIQSIIGAFIGAVEIVLGVAIDILSDGALEPLGSALIGAGLAGIQYSAMSSGSFSWKQYGIQQGVGAVLGLMTGGFGGEAEAGVAGVSEVSELELGQTAVARAEQQAEATLASAEGDSLASATNGAAEQGLAGDAADSLASAGGDAVCAAANSFTAGTLVLTPDGEVAIEKLRIGDLVLARSELTGAVEARSVVKLYAHVAADLIDLTFTDDDGATETVRATPVHPFWVRDEGWVDAGQLIAGDEIYLADGTWALVEKAAPTADEVWVYNLAVEELHTFFVGELGEWVHNCNPFAILLANGGRITTQRLAVVGENQFSRVLPLARRLAAREISRDWPRDLPVRNLDGSLLTRLQLQEPIDFNIAWLRSLMDQRYAFYDVGIDLSRTLRSPFYEAELRDLQSSSYTFRRIQALLGNGQRVTEGGVWLPPLGLH